MHVASNDVYQLNVQSSCSSAKDEQVDIAKKINLLGLTIPELKKVFSDIGEKPFRAIQIFKWIHQHLADDFDVMTDLGKQLRARLPEVAEIKAPEIVLEQAAKDGTRKWLMRLSCGNNIEAVFIPEKSRGTLCVSSQVGCALNCTFCSTATQGFNRNLTAAEIIGQVWLANKRLRELEKERNEAVTNAQEQSESNIIGRQEITNIVMMGMGEPMLNFENVVNAMAIMRDDNAYGLSRRRVTLSTSGLVPYIDRLSVESDVALAVSLHAPNDKLRDELVPINKKYPIVELMNACKRYVGQDNRRRITMEYVMLQGVNDKPEQARQLIKILNGVPCKVNLIPFNPYPGARYICSKKDDIRIFQEIMMKAGFITTVRRTRGDDIDAACGQLVGKIEDRTSRNRLWTQKLQSEKA